MRGLLEALPREQMVPDGDGNEWACSCPWTPRWGQCVSDFPSHQGTLTVRIQCAGLSLYPFLLPQAHSVTDCATSLTGFIRLLVHPRPHDMLVLSIAAKNMKQAEVAVALEKLQSLVHGDPQEEQPFCLWLAW